MPRPLLCLTALAAALSWSGAAIAQEQPPEPGPRGGRLFISPAGEPFRGPEALKHWFDGADADHDGQLTLAEFRADFLRYFKVLDANHDGVVDGIENGVYETRIVPEITSLGPAEPSGGPPEGGRGGRRHGGGMGRGGDSDREGRPRGAGGGMARREGAARFSLLNIPQPIRGADINLDWKVTSEEWAKAAAQRFALLDVDADGRLTLDTLPTVPGQGRLNGHGPRDHQETSPRHQN